MKTGIFLVVVIIYNIVAPKDFISKTISPKSYWTERVAYLEKKIQSNNEIVSKANIPKLIEELIEANNQLNKKYQYP